MAGVVLWNYPKVNVAKSHWWLVNIGSGNDLVPPGNKTIIWAFFDSILRPLMTSQGHNVSASFEQYLINTFLSTHNELTVLEESVAKSSN